MKILPRRGGGLDWLQTIATAWMGIWVISPPLAYGEVWRTIALAAAFLWLACEVIRPNGVIQRPSKLVLGAAVYVLYTLIIELIVPDITGITSFFQIWILCLFLVISESIRRRGADGFLPFFYLTLVLMPIWMFMTLYGYETIAADASRTISRSSDEARELSAAGIGGYGFVYALVLALPVLAFMSFQSALFLVEKGRQTSIKWRKWLVRGNFALAFLVVLNAGYAIALMISFLTLVLVTVFRAERTHVILKSVALAILIGVVSIIFVGSALDVMEEWASGTEYQAKVEDLRYSLERSEATGTVETRWERYSRSINLFMENPFIGTLTFDNVGKHSSYLDHFAQYGMFVGALFFFLLAYRPYSFMNSDVIPAVLSFSVLLVVLLLPLLNNVFGAFGFILFLFYPGAIAYISQAANFRARAAESGSRCKRQSVSLLQ